MKVISYRPGRIPQIGTPQKKSLKRIPDIRKIFNRSDLLNPVPLVVWNRNHQKILSFNRNISSIPGADQIHPLKRKCGLVCKRNQYPVLFMGDDTLGL
jgi:hypothetical protein